MNPRLKKGLIVAVLHLAIVGSLGVKLLVDRATRPRAWARTGPIDPDSPLRGRYVRLRVEGEPIDFGDASDLSVRLTESNGLLAFTPASGNLTARVSTRDGRRVAILDQPLAFFIPEHVPDPSVRQPGEELWVEVTVPSQGPPRPIRLGVRKDGALMPLPID